MRPTSIERSTIINTIFPSYTPTNLFSNNSCSIMCKIQICKVILLDKSCCYFLKQLNNSVKMVPSLSVQGITCCIYTEPLVFKTIEGQVWILLSTDTTLMMVWGREFLLVQEMELHSNALTLLDTGTSGEDSVTLDIWVITVVTTARLEALWSTNCVAWDTTPHLVAVC